MSGISGICKSSFDPLNTIRITIRIFSNNCVFQNKRPQLFNHSEGKLQERPNFSSFGGNYFFLRLCLCHSRRGKPYSLILSQPRVFSFISTWHSRRQLYLNVPQRGDDRATVVWFAEVAIIATKVTALCKFFFFFPGWTPCYFRCGDLLPATSALLKNKFLKLAAAHDF